MRIWRYGHAIERLGQRYRLEGVLGSGGMADVCLAWDERGKREVAVKVIKPDEMDQRTLNRFLKEAGHVSRWRHPHILRVYGPARLELLDPVRGTVVPYIVMEYAEGGDLHKRLIPGEPLPLEQTLPIFAQLCSAVSFAHSQGVIHRDLKPLNILFRRAPASSPHNPYETLSPDNEQVALSDFGLAVEADATHFTFAGGGTLHYMAPEQFQGRARPASDIFALGVILYHLCTGHLPFRRSLAELRRTAGQPQPPPPRASRLNPALPRALDTVLATALAEDPSYRFADALDFWQELYAIFATIPTYIHLLPTADQLSIPWDDDAQPFDDRLYETDEEASALPNERAGMPPAEWGQTGPSSGIGQRDGRAQAGPSSKIRGHEAEFTRLAASDPQILDLPPPLPSSGSASTPPLRSAAGPGRPRIATARRSRSRHGPMPGTPIQTDPLAHSKMASEQDFVRTSGSASVGYNSIHRAQERNGRAAAGPYTKTISRLFHGTGKRRWLLVALPILLVATLAVILSGAIATPFSLVPTATLTITPTSKQASGTFTFHAVANPATAPEPAPNEILARTVTGKSTSNAVQIQGTGKKHVPATQAKGTLTFSNGAFVEHIVPSGTIITSKSGIQITTDADAKIPPANSDTAKTGTVDVPAHATNAGSNGNIPAQDIFQSCCIPNVIFVKNLTAFTGGQDAQDYTYIQQSDVDGAANPMKAEQEQRARQDLQGQLKEGEALTGMGPCESKVHTDQPIGDQGKNTSAASVTVEATCLEAAYSKETALNRMQSRLKQQTFSELSQAEMDHHKPVQRGLDFRRHASLNEHRQAENGGGDELFINVDLTVLWIYQWSRQEQQELARHVAGLSKNDAERWLKQQTGVANEFIEVTGLFQTDHLPGDVGRIRVVVREEK